MADIALEAQNNIRTLLHTHIATLLASNKIEIYEEEYDEALQKWTITLDFNEGSPKSLVIVLNLNPDD